MKDYITVVGLDVHKESIEVALADTYGKREIRHYGKIGGDMASLDKTVRKLVSRGSRLEFVYEAGPCGYEIYRHLTKQGYHCEVVAPSMIPRRSGNRIKNDRRDAEALARLYRAGELTTVYVPGEEDEDEGSDTRQAGCGKRVAYSKTAAWSFSASSWYSLWKEDMLGTCS